MQCVEETFVQQTIMEQQHTALNKYQELHINDSIKIEEYKDAVSLAEGENTRLLKRSEKIEQRNKLNKTLRNIFFITTIILTSYAIVESKL